MDEFNLSKREFNCLTGDPSNPFDVEVFSTKDVKEFIRLELEKTNQEPIAKIMPASCTYENGYGAGWRNAMRFIRIEIDKLAGDKLCI